MYLFFSFHRLVQHAYCDGQRTQSDRQFPDGPPPFLVLNVEFLVATGVLGEQDITMDTQFSWQKVYEDLGPALHNFLEQIKLYMVLI